MRGCKVLGCECKDCNAPYHNWDRTSEEKNLYNAIPTKTESFYDEYKQKTEIKKQLYVHYMEDDERKTYNYIYIIKGREEAEKYLDVLYDTLLERRATEVSKQSKQFAKEKPLEAAAVSIMQTPFNYMAILDTAVNAVTGDKVNTNSVHYDVVHSKNDIAQGLTEDKGTIGSLLIQTSLSMGDMLTALPFGPGASLAILGTNAASSSAYDATKRGASAKEALVVGVAAGTIEAITEKIGIDNLFKISKLPSSTWKQAIKTIAKQSGTEGMEEFVSEILNNMVDEAVMGENSNYNAIINYYTENGYSKEDAIKKAFVESYVSGPLKAALGGMISGGVFGTGAVALTSASNLSLGKDIKKSEDAHIVIERAIEHGINSTDKKVREIATRVYEQSEDGIENVSNKDLGALVRNAFENKYNVFTGTEIVEEAPEPKKTFGEKVKGAVDYVGDLFKDNTVQKINAPRVPSTEGSTINLPKAEQPQVKAPVSTEVSINAPVKTVDVQSAIERITSGTATNKDYDLFKPANAKNRQMFEDATGVKLPATNSGTRKYLRGYVSEQNGVVYADNDVVTPNLENITDIQDMSTDLSVSDSQLRTDFETEVDNVVSVDDNTARKMADNRVAVQIMSETPSVVLENAEDSENLPIIMNFTKLYLAVRNDGVIKGNYHNLGTDIVKRLPEFLSNPDAILRLENGRLNFLTRVQTDKGDNGILSLELNSTKDIGDGYKKYNVIVTLFSGDDNYVENLVNKDGISVVYQNEDLPQVNPQLYNWLAIINGKSSNNNIPQDGNVVNSQYMQNGLNNTTESDIPSFEDFRETVLKQYPNMLEYDIREAYNKFYGLTNNGANDIIETDEVYYQRRGTDAEQQGRNNGNGNQQGGQNIKSADTVRTEGNKFRNGREYRTGRTGLWQKIHGRVRGTLKKATTKYIKHGSRAIMFTEYDNASAVKKFFKDVYNRDVIVCDEDIIEKDLGRKEMPEFYASGAYVQGSILISLGKNAETSLVHEMVHEGQNDAEYTSAVSSIKSLINMSALDKLISDKSSDYIATYGNRAGFNDDIGYEAMADIISRLATKEWYEPNSGKDLFADMDSYNKAKEIAEDYVVYLINNPPQQDLKASIKDISELEGDFADDYMFEKADEHQPYFALKESEAEKAIAFVEENYGERYRELIEKYGAIKKGAQPRVEESETPKRSSQNKYVSQYARTMAESGLMKGEMEDEFKKMVVEDKMSHEVFTDKMAEKGAEARVKFNGFEESVDEFSGNVKSGRLNKEDIALGQMLFNLACQNKDTKLAMELAIDLSLAATQFGQNVQAFSMLKKMSPDGQLYYLEKSLQKINKDLLDQYKGNFKKIEIDPKLAEDLLNAQTQEDIDDAIHAIERNIGEQLPSDFADKWNAWRYLSMLGNTRTHIRNIVGNAAFVPARNMKNVMGAGIEKMFLPKAERTKSVIKSADSKDFAAQDWEFMADIVKGNEGKYGTKRNIEAHRKIFKTKWLEALRKFNLNSLEAEDIWFLKGAYKDAFAQAMTARGLSSEFLNSGTKEANEQLESLRNYAINEAQRATYRDSNAFSDFVSQLGYKGDNPAGIVADKLIEGALPFKKTPANILVRGVEYSPIGFVKGLVDVCTKVKNGKMSAIKAIDEISSGLVGTGVVALGYLMCKMGVLVVAPDEDDEVSGYKKMLGAQNYALKIGNHTYTIDWMAPAALPLFVGAEMFNTVDNTDKVTFTALCDALTRISEPAFELSCLSGVQNALESIRYAEGNEIVWELLGSMATSYVQQALPTIGGQFARTIDNTKRNSYYKDKNSAWPEFLNGFIQQAAAKIPGATRLLPEKIDRWGRTEKYGSLPERVLENFVSPGYYSNDKSTLIDKKLLELYEKTGEKSILPDVAAKSFLVDGTRDYLSSDEYVEYSKIRGSLSYEYITKFMTELGTNTLSDSKKVEVIKSLYGYANAKAKTRVSDYKLDSQYEKVEKAKNAGISPDKYYVAYHSAKGFVSDKNSKGNSIQYSKSRKEMQAIKKNVKGLSERSLYKLFEIMGYSENQIKDFRYNLPRKN